MNKKISGRYRFLMRVDFRRKHFLRIQAATYFLCFSLLCAMSIWIDNMGKIRQVEAAERYGAWQYGLIGASEEEMELIEKNQLLKSTGRAVVYGEFYSEENYPLGTVGTLEESVLQLCGMKLLSGHLPQKANEVVLEQNTLEQLGVPYALDKALTLKIAGTEDGSPQEVTYILCGILQSNSAYTKAGSYLPTVVVSEEGGIAIAAYGQQELFIQAVEGCNVTAVRQDLIAATLRESSGTEQESEWIQNAFVYGEDFMQGDTGRPRLFISFIGYAVIFGLAFTHIFRERKRTDILRTLGMMEQEILLLLIGEQLIIWLAAMLSGLVLGGAGIRLLLQSYVHSQNLQTEISYPIASIQVICIISSLSLLAGGLAGALCSKLKGSYRKAQEMDYRILEKGRISPLKGNMKNALRWREFQVRRGVYIRFFCLQVLMFTAVAFCGGWMYLHYEGYRFNKNSYICDYIITSSAEDGRGSTVDDNFLNRIRNMDGVEKVETVYWNSQVEILDEEVR
ncbi:MAG: ABC transporter permease, partial [Lachnospiraceae bacterium]|nr:ABC transporter permease [Lachnospiraceae bacterium]